VNPVNTYLKTHLNHFADEQLNLLGTVQTQVNHFSSLYIFRLGCKTTSRRAARRLIVLHPKQSRDPGNYEPCVTGPTARLLNTQVSPDLNLTQDIYHLTDVRKGIERASERIFPFRRWPGETSYAYL